MRFLQSIIGSILVWVSIASGLGLWTLVVSNLVRLIWELRIVYGEYGAMLFQLTSTPNRNHLNWRKEIWPLQWRLAIQSVCSYFATWFIVPVTFRFHGEIAAGQIGLTWQLLTTVQAASFAWLQTRLPRFGTLLAAKKHQQFEREVFRASFLSIAVFLGGMVAFFAAVSLSKQAGVNLASRFISDSAILFFALGMIGWTLAMAEQSYVRLFKTDPFLLISVFASCLVASAIWHFGSTSGPYGLSIASFHGSTPSRSAHGFSSGIGANGEVLSSKANRPGLTAFPPLSPLWGSGPLRFPPRNLARLDQQERSAILPAVDCSWLTFVDAGGTPPDLPCSIDVGKLELWTSRIRFRPKGLQIRAHFSVCRHC
jgi:hypothetical protein